MKKMLIIIFLISGICFCQDSTLIIIGESLFLTVDSQNPYVEWQSPNGGEEYENGAEILGEWNASDSSFGDTPVSIYLSGDIGAFYLPLDEAIMNNGSHLLFLPEINTAFAKIKIEVIDDFGMLPQISAILISLLVHRFFMVM